MSAPERIWINWRAANKADLAYDDPPLTQWDDVSEPYVRDDLYTAALAENERLRAKLEKAVEAMKPFADCVFNDSGDVTVSYGDLPGSAFVTAYFTLKDITHD